jgi:uncharacterized alkaline shock family protein YloU
MAMTGDRDTTGPIGFEPEDLDGHTIDELTDYLDAGRTPLDPSIEQSAGCQLALDALAYLYQLTPALIVSDAAAESEPDEGWVQKILGGIVLDARAGRRIPLSAPADTDLGITEGAVRGLIRAAENTIPGVLIGRCRLDGEVTVPGSPIRIDVELSVPYGRSIVSITDQLRAEIATRLATHTELNVTGIDITVYDIQNIPPLGKETP